MTNRYGTLDRGPGDQDFPGEGHSFSLDELVYLFARSSLSASLRSFKLLL